MIYGNDVVLGKMYERTSRKGTTYFLGRLGMANVVLVKSDDVSPSGQPVWHLKVSEPAPKQDVKETARTQSADSGYPSNGHTFSGDRDIPF